MNKVLIIFKHEFGLITKGKVFIIMTLLGPLLFGAITILPSYFAIKSSEMEKNAVIAIYSEDENVTRYLSNELKSSDINVISVENIDSGKSTVLNDKSKGLIIIPEDIINSKKLDYFSSTGTDVQYSKEIERILRKYIFEKKKQSLGLSLKESNWLSNEITVTKLKISSDGEINNSGYESVMIVSIVISILIMMTVLIYGLTAARSVLSEKSSKTVELLLSSVKPEQILLGKVLGAGVAGFIQFSTWILMALIGIKYLVPIMDINIPNNLITPENFIIIFIYFILAIFFYMFIYAALGANVENEQNLGQVQLPLQLALMVPMMISSSLISNPNGGISTFLSYFPFTSSSAMIIRVLVDSPGILQVIISVLILFVSMTFILFTSGKLFKMGLLTKGKKVNFIQVILRLVKR